MGIFASEIGGQFAPESGGQFNRFMQLVLAFKAEKIIYLLQSFLLLNAVSVINKRF